MNVGALPESEKPAEQAPVPAPVVPARAEPEGCLSAVGWFGAGAVLSCFSPTFYHRAARRRLGWAIGFFLAFSIAVTGLQSLALIRGLVQAGQEIGRAFESGEIPQITISNGVAEISGPQPFVLVDDGQNLVVLDTTGTYTAEDLRRYDQGFILTRTTMAGVSESGRYQEFSLSDLQAALDIDPFVLNAETGTAYWATVSVIVAPLGFVALAFWNGLIRLVYLTMIALVLWGVSAVLRPGTGFGPVLITGLYAIVPVLYARLLLSQIGIGFFGLFTLLLLPVWAATLAVALRPRTERPLRAWRALLALPLLLDFALEVIFGWDAWYVTWPLTALTLIALLAVSWRPPSTKTAAGLPTQ